MKHIIEKIFGTGSEEKENERLLKSNRKKDAKVIASMQKEVDCRTSLKTCDREFADVIEDEKRLIREKKRMGYPADDSLERIRQALIGRLVVRNALLELQRSQAEDRLNRAMNQLGVSVRQLYKLYGAQVKEKNLESVLSMLPESGGNGLDEEKMRRMLEADDRYSVPDTVAGLVDETFVDDLLEGNSMEECLELSRDRAAAEAKARAEERTKEIDILDVKLSDAAEGTGEAEKTSGEIQEQVKDYAAILRKNADKH